MMLWSTVLFAGCILISQSAMDFFGALLFLSVAADVYKKRRSGTPWSALLQPTGFDWIWPLWLAVIGLSYLTSPIPETEAFKHLFEFKWIVLFYSTAYALRELNPQPKFQKAASLFLGVCSLYAVVIWFLGYDPIHPNYDMAPWVGGRRTGGLLSNAMVFGHVYGAALSLFIGAMFFAWIGKSREKSFLTIAVILTGLGLLFSFTRGAWIAAAAAVLAMGFFYRWKLGLLVTGAGAAALGLAAVLWPTFHQRITHISSTGDERQWIWAGHWRIFLDHPWTGVGYGENYKLIPEYYKQIGAPEGVLVSHAHNQYLHFLAGSGVIGLIAYLLVLGLFFGLSWRVFRKIPANDFFRKGLALGALGAQVFFWVGGITEANFEHSKMKSVLVVVWGIVLWLAHETGVVQRRR